MTERNKKGQFVKGVSGNLKGRPKGSRNKTHTEIRTYACPSCGAKNTVIVVHTS